MWPLAIASIIGTLITNNTNKNLADDNRNFQENMANTSHQREMQDYAAAGINPMMASSTAGAGTPTQGPPTMQDPIGAAVSSAMQGMELMNAQKQIEQTDAKIANETKMTQATTDKIYADMGLVPFQKDDYLTKWKNVNADTAAKHLKNVEQRSENMRRGLTDKTFWKPANEASESLMRPWEAYKGIITKPFKEYIPQIFDKLMKNASGLINNAKDAAPNLDKKWPPQNDKTNPFGF